MRFEDIEKLLWAVEKPMRYCGGERNSVRKDRSSAKVRMAFAFPDVYEVGMSHLGLQILYRIVNAFPDLSMERVFCPWTDMEERLRGASLPLVTLESGTPLHEFDVVGFSLQYELSYTNVLNMLELGAIPIRSGERGENHPIVIAGGPVALNPEPMADFMDVFLLGDGEELLPEFLFALKTMKEAGASRRTILEALPAIPGVYVPSKTQTVTDPSSGYDVPVFESQRASSVRCRKLLDLDRFPFPSDPIVPSMGVVHDRYAVEISRGCNCGCRFCQAGSMYRPERFRSPESILDSVRKSIAMTGYDEVSLTSLSTGDYPGISSLVALLMTELTPRKISLSLSSLRPATLTETIVREIRKVRKTGFTLAPEAASERLRLVINKSSTEEDILRASRLAAEGGWESLKLYFMIGLPTETIEDVEAIPDLTLRILREGGKGRGKLRKVNLSVSSFVPKAHTPFQWSRMNSMEMLREKQRIIRSRLGSHRVQFKWHSVESSFLEAVFSRGDRKLGRVVQEAFRLGCRFDGWTDKLDFSKWIRAFEAAGISPHDYAERELNSLEKVPWDLIDTGWNKDHLKNDFRLALEGKPRERCEYTNCQGCGACDPAFIERESLRRAALRPAELREAIAPASAEPERPACYRCSFSKNGPSRYMSHLDLCTAIRRAFVRASVPVVYSKGFHPLPRISFGPPLPVGIAGENEWLDFLSPVLLEVDGIRGSLNNTLPEGISMLEVKFSGYGSSTLASDVDTACYAVSLKALDGHLGLDLPPEEESTFRFHEEKSEEFLSRTHQFMELRKKGGNFKEIDVRPFVRDMRLCRETREIHLDIMHSQEGSVRAADILKAVYGLDVPSFLIRRTKLALKK